MEQISGMVTKRPIVVQNGCLITGLTEKAVQLDKEATLFIDEKEAIQRLLFFLPDCLGAIKPTF